MHCIPLKIHGGGFLRVCGSLNAHQIIVLTGREDYNRDLVLMRQLFEFFAQSNHTIVQYESAGETAMRRINCAFFEHWPMRLRQFIKFFILLGMPKYWSALSRRHRELVRSTHYRMRAFSELIQFLGPDKELIFITRSASRCIATRLADEMGLCKVVCLGYPFQNPSRGAEPERYEHLSALQTPFLLVQGTRDIYGGFSMLGRYRFSTNTQLLSIDSDHDLVLSESEQLKLFMRIERFIDNS